MKYFKCENCGSELQKNADNTYSCSYCKRTYYDDSLEKAYDRVYQNLRGTVQGIVSEELLKQKIEQIANCRQALYKERNEQFVDNNEIARWAGEILQLSPKDAQANFYALAAKKRWGELNKFMQKLNAREVPYLVEGFVDYLTNGQFVEKCVLCLSDLIDRAFDGGSEEYEACHKKIVLADERERSGVFDVTLPRDVFVAYSSKDKEQAYELVEYLEKSGFSCFIAMRNLAKGVDAALKYNERLKKAMDSCRVFLLVSSSNSRARDCDAYRIEMQYIRECDCKKANDSALANARYEEYLEKNRSRCKPRVEYLIEGYGSSPYEKMVKKFFGGLTWCRSLESVSDAVFELIEGAELEEVQDEKFARERAELETQKAEMERRKAELAKKEQELSQRQNATVPTGNIEDLYKAFKEREREEELERKRQAEEAEQKQKEEELLRKGFQIQNGVLKKYVGGWSKVVIPSCVISIEKCAFADSNISEVTMLTSVTEIGESAFLRCKNLKTVTIPASVTKIGSSPFGYCNRLSEIRVDPKNENYKSLNGVLYTKNGEVLLQYPVGNTAEEFTVPETVVSIGKYAFASNYYLEKVTLSKSVETIGDRAFADVRYLREVKNLSSVKTMGSNVFAGTYELTFSVNLSKAPDGWAKDWDGGNTVVWTRSLEAMEAARKKKAEEKERKEAEARSKEDFLIEKVAGFYTLKQYMGKDEYVIIPKRVEHIDKRAFKGNNVIRKVRFTSAVQIYNEAFADCGKLQEVIFDENITGKCYVGARAFSNCKNLMRIRLPKTSVDIYGNKGVFSDMGRPFENCYKLVEIYDASFLTISRDERDQWGSIGFYAKNIYTPTFGESRLLIDDNGYALYREGDDNILVGYCGTETEIVLPEGVTQIYQYAFYDCEEIKTVTIPNSVTSIGENAFNRCRSLESIIIPDSVITISEGAFDFCSSLKRAEISKKTKIKGAFRDMQIVSYRETQEDRLRQQEEEIKIDFEIENGVLKKYKGKGGDVAIPNSVTSIGDRAFERCASLTSVKIPNSVTSIGPSAFNECSGLKNVEIGNSVTSIASYAFCDCNSLTSIEIPSSTALIEHSAFLACRNLISIKVDEGNSAYKDIDGNLYSKDGKTLIQYAIGKKETEFAILESVTLIADGAFQYCESLTNVVIPNSITSIGNYTFYACHGLTNIEIPNSVTKIDSYAFQSCRNLTRVVIGNGVTSIGYSAFAACGSLAEVSLGASVNLIDKFAFHKCSSLTKIVLPNSVKSIGISAFSSCEKLTTVVMSDAVEKIGSSAFAHCGSLTSITIPDSVTAIVKETFLFCSSLTNLVIGKGVTSIGPDAFNCCRSLERIIIPDSVVTISKGAFHLCSSLKKVEVSKKTKITGAFENMQIVSYREPQGDFQIEDGVLIKYKGKDKDVVIPDGVTVIGSFAFADCTSLTNIILPNGLTEIRSYAFSGCSSLESIVIPNSVTSIGSFAFAHCKSLTSVVIPDSVTSIGSSMAGWCTNLRKILIPESVISIGGETFLGCANLTIFAETNSRPEGWVQPLLFRWKNWNPDKRPVKWGATKADFDKA